jgi:hypothetical protein
MEVIKWRTGYIKVGKNTEERIQNMHRPTNLIIIIDGFYRAVVICVMHMISITLFLSYQYKDHCVSLNCIVYECNCVIRGPIGYTNSLFVSKYIICICMFLYSILECPFIW